MSETIDDQELGGLLAATGRAHHAAYAASDGVDPDWAIWYAGNLQAHLGDRLGSVPSRGELTYLLVAAEHAYAEAGEERGTWPAFYARFILERFRGG